MKKNIIEKFLTQKFGKINISENLLGFNFYFVLEKDENSFYKLLQTENSLLLEKLGLINLMISEKNFNGSTGIDLIKKDEEKLLPELNILEKK